ncbi:MAG: hypothetical protein JWQ90_767 [Hydrocarboniphaga sp.]|uniref:helix-turn-helix domain-containing protein n=1 Tax=Hydrocarboniphaga sp. TaxID=2033016 RepID=UPI002609778F|nr:helix-turn-helix transcriptional regulator [Hydrocarboniphaga sp.]MDB5968317.1 hypothetical protein [Hydrocarboniphaga sp.]
MIRFKLRELMAEKQFREGRLLTINEVASDADVSRITLSRLLNQKGYGTGTETLDRLCRYFGCRIEDLAEYVPE